MTPANNRLSRAVLCLGDKRKAAAVAVVGRRLCRLDGEDLVNEATADREAASVASAASAASAAAAAFASLRSFQAHRHHDGGIP